MVPAGNKAKRLSLFNHFTKTIHHHHHHHHHHHQLNVQFFDYQSAQCFFLKQRRIILDLVFGKILQPIQVDEVVFQPYKQLFYL